MRVRAQLIFKRLQSMAAVKWHLVGHRQFDKMRLIFCNDYESDLAGQAWVSSSTIEINLAYFNLDNEADLRQIIAHEMCHLLEPLVYWGEDESDHGVGWRQLMTDLGFEPEAEHTLEVKNVS